MSESPGADLALLLLAAFRSLIDELHTELAREGHPDLRAAYGFALQAIGRDGTTAAELGRRLGVSKQAAGKTIDVLQRRGYVARENDPTDARRTRIHLTCRGEDLIRRSALIFDRLRADWADRVGERRLRQLEADLVAITDGAMLRLDTSAWFGGGTRNSASSG